MTLLIAALYDELWATEVGSAAEDDAIELLGYSVSVMSHYCEDVLGLS